MKKFFSRFVTVLDFTFVAVVVLIVSCTMLYILRDVVSAVSPLVTSVAVLGLTLNSFKRWTTATMAVIGIVLFVASWHIASTSNIWIGQLVWGAGVVTWFVAVWRSFMTIDNKETKVTAAVIR